MFKKMCSAAKRIRYLNFPRQFNTFWSMMQDLRAKHY